MAIDSKQKRQSAASVGKVWKGKVVVPGGSIDATQRLNVAWKYSGIPVGAAIGGSLTRAVSLRSLVGGDTYTSYSGGFLDQAIPGSKIDIKWTTNDLDNGKITATTATDVRVYKGSSLTQSTSGVTVSIDHDGETGVHLVSVNTSADTTFYSLGSIFHVLVVGMTVDGQTVDHPIKSFSLGNLVS